MAQGIATKLCREKLCRAHSGDIALPRITHMAFGNGGVNEAGEVIETSGDEIELKNELLRKEIDEHIYPGEEQTTCRYRVRLTKDELANENISEQGLYDEEGDLMGYKTFLPKGKDADMEFIFDMDEIF